MNLAWLAVHIALTTSGGGRQFPVQFARAVTGSEVTVCVDGWKVEQTFAGKLGFRDATHAWQSVCADISRPVSSGQFFVVRALNSQAVGGNVAKAGNIVASCFNLARTPEQCAGLQIAVWKALEDGEDQADFGSGNLEVRASPAILMWAQEYYAAIDRPGTALYLQAGGGGAGAGQGAGGGQGGGGGGGQSQLTTP